jgi:hypothetical protein
MEEASADMIPASTGHVARLPGQSFICPVTQLLVHSTDLELSAAANTSSSTWFTAGCYVLQILCSVVPQFFGSTCEWHLGEVKLQWACVPAVLGNIV